MSIHWHATMVLYTGQDDNPYPKGTTEAIPRPAASTYQEARDNMRELLVSCRDDPKPLDDAVRAKWQRAVAQWDDGHATVTVMMPWGHFDASVTACQGAPDACGNVRVQLPGT